MVQKILLILFCFLFILGAHAADTVFRIDIQGNDIVSDAAIVSKVKIRAGQPYNENVINEDVKNLYATGFFETVEVDKKDTVGGLVVVFKVKEKPVISTIEIQGARFIREKQILKEIDIQEGTFVDAYKMKETVRKIKDLYTTKGFAQAQIDYDLVAIEGKNSVDAKIIIDEQGVLKVRKIYVEGNNSISAGRIIKAMKTRPAWLFNRGIFKQDVLEDDIRRVTAFYQSEGFSDVAVDVDIDYRPKGVYLTVVIDEGKRYYVGNITVEGSQDISLEEIMAAMDLKEDSIYSEQAVYEDSSKVREVYVDKGYIFSQVAPFSFLNEETSKVDIIYRIAENQVAYIEDIDIRGNSKTKDRVIRRELRVYPGERFDGKEVRRSKERLENLGFFEDVRFGTEPGTEDNEVDLVVDIKEAKTGYVSFGGGYSTIEEFVGFIELRQRNFDFANWSTFTGAGQDLTFMASLGSLTQRYQLSFTNPWIFDKPISFGFDVYKKGHSRDDDSGYAYKQEVTGGLLRLGKSFTDYFSGGVAYRFESIEISDVDKTASKQLKNEVGTTDLSTVETSLTYDTRDNVFSPSTGILALNSFGVTGGPLGGDENFMKYFGSLSFYFPMPKKAVVEFRVRGGLVSPFDDTDDIVVYERFFAGGASTIRGYDERAIGPVDRRGDPLGGESLFIANVEYTYPLADFIKVAGFFDTGNVWKEYNEMDTTLYSSVGLGLRVKTPIGPVKVDYGWPLDVAPGETGQTGKFHFSVSRGF